MQAAADKRVSRPAAHRPVEKGTPDGKTTISCAGPRCVAWDPQPFDSRHEAQFWYDRHISQPLIHQLW